MNRFLILVISLTSIRLCEALDEKSLLKKVVFYREVNPNNYYNYYFFTKNTQVIFTIAQENSLELQYESLDEYNISSFNSLFFKNLSIQYVLKEKYFENKIYDFQLGKKICYEKFINLNTIKQEGITKYKAPVLTYKILFEDEIFLCKFEPTEVIENNSSETTLRGIIYGFNKKEKLWTYHLGINNKCNDLSKMYDVQFLDTPFFKNMQKDITDITSVEIKDDLIGNKKNDQKMSPLSGISIKRFKNSKGFFTKEAEVEFLPKKGKTIKPIYGSLDQKEKINEDSFFQLTRIEENDIFQYRVSSDDHVLCKFVSNANFLQKSIWEKGIILRGKIYTSRNNGNTWSVEDKEDECSLDTRILEPKFINKRKLFLNIPRNYKINFLVTQQKINLKDKEELTDQDFKELMSFFKQCKFSFKDFMPMTRFGMKCHTKEHSVYYDDEDCKEAYPGYYNFEKKRLTDVLKNKNDLLKIKHLDLSDRNLKHLPLALFKLTNLTHLYLNDNQIEFLPEEIGWLKNLRFLNLDYNRLQMLPFNLQVIPSLKIWCRSQHFNFYDEEIPESIYNKVLIDSSRDRGMETLIDRKIHLN